jgi:hypothetical protein
VAVDYPLVTGWDLARVLGDRVPPAALDQAAEIVDGLILGWTRGRSRAGDVVVPYDLRAVALAAALRLAVNVTQQGAVTAGEQTLTGAFRGFTITEQIVLNRYRRRCV